MFPFYSQEPARGNSKVLGMGARLATKSPQVGMTVFALVRHEELDFKRLQGRLIKGQRTFDIADSKNNVVERRSPPLNHECFKGLFAIGYRMDRKRRYVHFHSSTTSGSACSMRLRT